MVGKESWFHQHHPPPPLPPTPKEPPCLNSETQEHRLTESTDLRINWFMHSVGFLRIWVHFFPQTESDCYGFAVDLLATWMKPSVWMEAPAVWNGNARWRVKNHSNDQFIVLEWSESDKPVAQKQARNATLIWHIWQRWYYSLAFCR